YSLSAFFNSIDENGMYDNAAKVPSPTLLLPTAEQEKQLTDAVAAVKAAERRLTGENARGSERIAAWTSTNTSSNAGGSANAGTVNTAASAQDSIPDLLAHFTFDGDQTELKGESPHETAAGATNGLPQVVGRQGRAIRCDGDRGVTFSNLLNA